MKLDTLEGLIPVEDNWFAFVRAVNKINTEGFLFNKLQFLADCKQLGSFIGSKEHFAAYEKGSTNLTLTYDKLRELLADDAALTTYISDLCSGKDKEYADKIKKLYFEEEEGSTLEAVYAALIKAQKQYLEGTKQTDLLGHYCIDTVGTLHIDTDHLRFLIEVIKRLNEKPEHNWTKGVIHDIEADFRIISDCLRVKEFFDMPYMANALVDTVKTPKSEFVGLKGYIKKGRINPNFRRDMNLGISWSGCKQIVKDYVMSYTIPDGYKGYYYERPGLAYTVLAASVLDTDLVSAKKYLDEAKEGCIYACLSKQYEQKHIRQLLSGDFCNFDGLFGKQLTDWYLSCDGAGSTGIFDYYTVEIAPVMQVMVGEVLGYIEQQEFDPDICEITWIRDDSFVLIVREDTDLVDIVSEKYAKYFKPVPDSNMLLILNDNFNV